MGSTVRVCSILFLACTVIAGCAGNSSSGNSDNDTVIGEAFIYETTGNETTGNETTGDETTGDETPIDINEVERLLGAAELLSFDEEHPISTNQSEADLLSMRNGNTADTLGGQRLMVFRYALGIIATEMRITQTIETVFCDSTSIGCSPVAAASYNRSWFNRIGQIPNVLYPTALSNQLSETDTSAADVWIQISQLHLDGECDRSLYYGFAPSVEAPLIRDFVHIGQLVRQRPGRCV